MEETFSHGLMFHYFFGGEKKIPYTQGAMDGKQFEKIIERYNKEYNLINAQEYYNKAISGTLGRDDVCITFDDGLKCQFDVAFPILQKHGLTAFWFVYTSPCVGVFETLEVYRVFRNSCFDGMDAFYNDFKEQLRDENGGFVAWNSQAAYEYKNSAKYYTENDRRFRYVRDVFLEKDKYDVIMNRLMKKHNFDINSCKDCWINEKEYRELSSDGQILGLHSHTHPTVMTDMSYSDKFKEYETNKVIIENATGVNVKTASYPCGSYDEEILDIMRKMDIELAFIPRKYFNNNNCLIMPRMDGMLIK